MTIQTSNATMPFSDLMGLFEEYVEFPYDDGKRIASIGIGINIENNRQYLALVLRELKVFSASDATVTGAETEAQRNARYTRIIDRFQSILSSAVLNRLGSESAGGNQRQRANPQSELERRASQLRRRGPRIRLDPVSAVRVVDYIVYGSEIGPDLNGNGAGFMRDEGKAARLDTRLRSATDVNGQPYGIVLPRSSREYQALLSMLIALLTPVIGGAQQLPTRMCSQIEQLQMRRLARA